MLSEYEMQLIFIRGLESEMPTCFLQEAERELESLYTGKEIRELRYKSVDGAEIVIAELEGKNRYRTEQEALDDLRERGSELFWSWLQGYRVVVDEKDTSCGCCKLKRQ